VSTRRTPAPSPPQSTTWTAAALLPRQGSRQSPDFWLQMQALLSSSMARAMAAECGLAAQVRQVNTGAHAFVQTSRPNRPGWSPTRHGRAPISRRLRLSWPASPPNKIPPTARTGGRKQVFFPDPPFSLGNTRVHGEDRGFLHALGRAAISSRPNRTS